MGSRVPLDFDLGIVLGLEVSTGLHAQNPNEVSHVLMRIRPNRNVNYFKTFRV